MDIPLQNKPLQGLVPHPGLYPIHRKMDLLEMISNQNNQLTQKYDSQPPFYQE